MKRKKTHYSTKRNYKVLWSYEDEIGVDSGVLDVIATSHKDAENIFYANNRSLVKRSKGNKVDYNAKGGFVVESVLTEEEWKHEGCPTSI